MNTLEENLITILKNLKTNFHVTAVKAEFEAEGATLEEITQLKKISDSVGLGLSVKIGGCESVRDIIDAKSIGADVIIAPMIESDYAMKKFVNAIKLIFSEQERKNTKFFINIETITGYENLDKITSSDEFKDIDGIVFGRTDMINSIGLSENDINSDTLLSMAQKISDRMQKMNKEFIIGGGVSIESIPFLKQISDSSFSKFETRKIVFDSVNALAEENIDLGLQKALEFEILWIKNKQESYQIYFEGDEKRLSVLETRYNKLVEEKDKIYA